MGDDAKLNSEPVFFFPPAPFRYLHSNRYIPPHDSHMRHGDIRRLQGESAPVSPSHSPLFHLPFEFPAQQHGAWIIPFFCYQIFDFALNTLVVVSVVVYPNTVQDYLQQLVSRKPLPMT